MDLLLFTFNESGTVYNVSKAAEGKKNFAVIGNNMLTNLLYGYTIRRAAGKDAKIYCFLDRNSEEVFKGEKIASIEDADLYEIKAAEPYSDADLNWNDSNSRTTKEQNDASVRPQIASEALSLEGYTKIYVGYPIWWGEEPRIMDTFVESYDFKDITMIPFCTSSSSGIGRSGKNLEENSGSGHWLEGKRFAGSVSEADLASWIKSLD